LRLVRDVFHVSGFVTFQDADHPCEIVLNQADSLASDSMCLSVQPSTDDLRRLQDHQIGKATIFLKDWPELLYYEPSIHFFSLGGGGSAHSICAPFK
jgi:hypothetical protein